MFACVILGAVSNTTVDVLYRFEIPKYQVDLGTINNTGSTITLGYTIAGTAATDGSDYTGITGTTGNVMIADGQQFATITLTPVDDTDFESDETVRLTLTSTSNAAVMLDVTPADVTLSDNDGPTATITAIDAMASETGPDTGQFRVDLGTINNTGSAITLGYTIAGTAATDGSDYTGITGTTGNVMIADGQQFATKWWGNCTRLNAGWLFRWVNNPCS